MQNNLITAPAQPSSSWIDTKRYAWLLGLIVPMAGLLSYALVKITGLSVFWWIGPLLVYVIIPLLDLVGGLDKANPPEEKTADLEQDRYYRWATFMYLPLQLASLVLGCWLWSGHTVLGFTPPDLSFIDKLGVMFTVGMIGGIGIANAHELGHKREASERWLARVVLAQTAYGHFYIEHNRGHHVRVATPEDPASSRMGENFWEFLPRTVIGAFRSGWHLEAQRLARLGKSPWTLENDVLNAWLMTVVLFTALVLVFGLAILPWLIVQAIYGASMLEVVNYLEHYGLLRQKMPDGRYERCQPSHSWNSNNIVSNVFLYHLQRHSDHHAHPTRRYQALRHFDNSPQLPTGYAGMIVLAMFPPLWYWVMDKRVLAHYGNDISKASLHPSARARLLHKYGKGA